QVLFDELVDARPLHLDGDFAPAAEHGAMHLPERRGGNRQPIELDERVRNADTELLADRPLDVFVGKWLDVVLQAGERLEVRGRKEVRARREELTELDERRAERLEVARERLGARGIG